MQVTEFQRPGSLALAVVSVAVGCCLFSLAAAPTGEAAQWFKTDTHVHSSAVSGDAPQDLGVISEMARRQGFNAMFISDHTAASTQPIAAVVANHLRLDDDLSAWTPDVYSSSGPASALQQSSLASVSTQ